jgi:hypothetical protein
VIDVYAQNGNGTVGSFRIGSFSVNSGQSVSELAADVAVAELASACPSLLYMGVKC